MPPEPTLSRNPEDPAEWDAWFAPGGRTAANRNRLVEVHMAFVERMLGWGSVRPPAGRPFDAEDMRQELAIVLMELVGSYDPRRCVCFQAYIRPRLPLRAVSIRRAQSFVSRNGHEKGIVVKTFTAGAFTCDEDADARGFEPPVWDEAGERADERDEAFADELVRSFPLHDRSFVRQRFIDGATCSATGDRHGRTESWASVAQARVLPVLVMRLGRPDLRTAKPVNQWPIVPDAVAAAPRPDGSKRRVKGGPRIRGTGGEPGRRQVARERLAA